MSLSSCLKPMLTKIFKITIEKDTNWQSNKDNNEGQFLIRKQCKPEDSGTSLKQ